MPRTLINRLRPNSIREYRAAAIERVIDGRGLVAAGRKTGAIYVWGYAAEMALKASYFELIRYSPRAPVGRIDLRQAVARATILGFAWPAPHHLHDLPAWAELLIRERAARSLPFNIGRRTILIRASQRLRLLWRETLRYHSNKAYSYEVEEAERLVRQIVNLCGIS